MKKRLWGGLLLGLFALSLVAVAAQERVKANPAFERMKTLVGKWEGEKDGKQVIVEISPVGGGSGLLERFTNEGTSDMGLMATVHFVDGGQLALTHYCLAGNQPRMRADYDAATNTIAYTFTGASNLASAEAGHMHKAIYVINGRDQFRSTWIWLQNGKETPHPMSFRRIE